MKDLQIHIIGAGLAGSEAALQLAARGVHVTLIEARPFWRSPVHESNLCAELVCSNSFKSTKPTSAAGMLKQELKALGSRLMHHASSSHVPAGGALAVDRYQFAQAVTDEIYSHPYIDVVIGKAKAFYPDGKVEITTEEHSSLMLPCADAIIVATGPITSDDLALHIAHITGNDNLSFYDAAAPIVMADSLNYDILFRQSRYEAGLEGDYLNAPFTRDEYDAFISALIEADTVVRRSFETKELFQACQPIEEIARRGHDAPRFGPMKPVGLTDPRTSHRPWAALQLRSEDKHGASYNLVGFQTNLTFPEQKRVFRMIPGLERAEFARFGVMHRNTFVDAPRVLSSSGSFSSETSWKGVPVFIAGQLAGTEGYSEAIRSGLQIALESYATLNQIDMPHMPTEMVFGALWSYATSSETVDYQPMHVNFGIMPPLEHPIRNKQQRYEAYALRGQEALSRWMSELRDAGLLSDE